MHLEKLTVNREVTHNNGDVSHWTVDILTETEEGTFRVYNPFTDLYEYFESIADTQVRYNKLYNDIIEINAQLEEHQRRLDELTAALENKNKTVVNVISVVNSTGAV